MKRKDSRFHPFPQGRARLPCRSSNRRLSLPQDTNAESPLRVNLHKWHQRYCRFRKDNVHARFHQKR